MIGVHVCEGCGKVYETIGRYLDCVESHLCCGQSDDIVTSVAGVHAFYSEDTGRYQADCDNCGWHTRECGSRTWTLTMATQHVADCPRIKPITAEQAERLGR